MLNHVACHIVDGEEDINDKDDNLFEHQRNRDAFSDRDKHLNNARCKKRVVKKKRHFIYPISD